MTDIIVVKIIAIIIIGLLGDQPYLHDDRDPRGQGLSLEHVQLASLSLAVKDAGDEDGEEQHGDDDQARHDEGEEVLLVR